MGEFVRFSRVVTLLCLCAALSGCALLQKESRALFQEQNKLKYELIEATEKAEARGDAKTVQLFEQAEVELAHACGPLFIVGASWFLKRVVTFWQKFLVLVHHDSCDAKVKEVREILNRHKLLGFGEKQKPPFR